MNFNGGPKIASVVLFDIFVISAFSAHSAVSVSVAFPRALHYIRVCDENRAAVARLQLSRKIFSREFAITVVIDYNAKRSGLFSSVSTICPTRPVDFKEKVLNLYY